MKAKAARFSLLLLVVFLLPARVFCAMNLAIEANPYPVRPSEQVNVELTVSNTGPGVISDVELVLTYPPNLNILNPTFITTGGSANTVECTTGGNTSSCVPGDIVTWSLGDLPAGRGVTVNMLPTVSGSAADGTVIPFAVEARSGGVQQTLANTSALVQADPFFELIVDEETDPVNGSGNYEYTITYGNTATDSSDTMLTFPLPAGTNFISATDGGTFSGGQVTWNLGSISGGEGGERRVTIDVNAEEGDLLLFDAVRLSGTDSSFISHQVSAGRITRIDNENRPNLKVNVHPKTVRPSEPINVELTISNPGTSVMSDIELLLRYPDHLGILNPAFITTGGSSNIVSCTAGGNTSSCVAGDIVTWNLGNLPPGGGMTVNMLPVVSGSTADGTLIQFEAEVRVAGVQQTLESGTARVQADPFFELIVNEEADPVATSGNRRYTISYGNIATSSSGTRLIFPLPAGTAYVSSTGGGTVNEGRVIWNLGSLAGGAGGERQVTVNAIAEEGDLLMVDPAQIIGTDSGFASHLVQAEEVTRLENNALPILAITLNPIPVEPAQQLNAVLTVTNPGATLMTNVELILRYPEHLNILNPSSITTGGAANTVSCTLGGNTSSCVPGDIVTWNLGNLPAGASVTVTMPPIVSGDTEEGILIPFDAEVRINGGQKLLLSRTAFVGTEYDIGLDEREEEGLCFPVKAKNGKVALICI